MHRAHRPLSPSHVWLAALLVFGMLSGCSSSRDNAMPFSPTQGQHPAGWAQPRAHAFAYVRNPEGCRSCHGSTRDPKAAGGISQVSCFQCHGSPDHPEGWAARVQHGRLGAQAAPSAATGFTACFTCHSDGNLLASGKLPSCTTCHAKVPHPAAPWTGASAAVATHTVTHEDNAPACATCHTAGAHSRRKPASPPAPNAAPSCFNNTLCHDRNLGQATSGPWDVAAGTR